jgi:two-component system sensor histidine kinase AlgZ
MQRVKRAPAKSVTKLRRPVIAHAPLSVSRASGADILTAMNAAPIIHPSPELAKTPAWRRVATIFLINVAIWTVLSALGALTSLNDDLRNGVQGSYWLILESWSDSSFVLAFQSLLLYMCFTRWPRWVSSAKSIALGYGLLLLILLPLQMIFLLKLYVQEDGPGLSWMTIEHNILTIDRFASLLRFSSTSAVYFAVVVLKVWEQNQMRSRAWAQAQADSIGLRLELEQQRGLALRAQLEPHFMFNALNAISALVRSDNKAVALVGIQGLSELLRYALIASEKTWVKLSEELEFVNEYLSLQRLRYGPRLQITMEGVDDAVLTCDCPPLLLQPLVENALRHDLDCHQRASDIRLTFACRDEQLQIRISNPVHQEAASNPGVGLGLRNTEARLQLAYDGMATISAGCVDGRFEVAIRLPMHSPEYARE